MRSAIYLLSFFLVSSSWAQSNSLKTPNISANALFLYRNSEKGKEDISTVRNGMDLREAEVAFDSDVDPYHRLSLLLSVHPEYTYNAGTDRIEQVWKIEPEELFAESLQAPDVTLKIGKFKAAFGKHNPLHTHAFPFVDAPLINTAAMGDEGLNDVGVSAALLLPAPWYSEVTGQFIRGEGENAEFSSKTPSDGVGLVHWKNLFDLNDDSTAELGASYVKGKNDLGGQTILTGADATYKWRPVEGGRYHSVIVSGEYINRSLEQPGAAAEKVNGYYTFAQFQFAERWSAASRFDYLKIQDSDSGFNSHSLTNDTISRSTLGLNFSGSEFSAYKLEYSWGPEKKIYLQANFTIGYHPSHSY